MRSLVALVLVLATAGVLVTSALGADPEPEKLGFSDTFIDPDFCGTRVPVSVESSFHGTLFNALNQSGYEFWLTLQHRTSSRISDGAEGDLSKCRDAALVVRARR